MRFHADLHRLLVRRYAAEQPGAVLCALEIVNEPDYVWTPEEVKIEGGGSELINPLGKYVTELQLAQVPVASTYNEPFERTAWGFQTQDAAWASHEHSAAGMLASTGGRNLTGTSSALRSCKPLSRARSRKRQRTYGWT